MKRVFVSLTASSRAAAVFFGVLVALTYANGLHNAFVSDDLVYLVNNPHIAGFRFVLDTPLTLLKALLDWGIYKAFGLRPEYFRILNIAFHWGSTCMVYLIVRKLTGARRAFLTAAVFAVHPVIVESVTWIGGGGYAQYGFFFLLSFFLYLTAGGSRKRLGASLAAYALCLLSSEKAVLLSLAFPVYELAFGTFRSRWKRTVPFLAVSMAWLSYIVGISGYFTDRMSLLHTDYYAAAGYDNPLVKIPYAVTKYLSLFFWPVRLSFYHADYPTAAPEMAFRATVLMLLIGVLVYVRRSRYVLFWTLFFVVSILITLSPLRLSWWVAERYAYLGTAGLAAVSVFAADRLLTGKSRAIEIVLFGCIVLTLSARSIVRNRDWRTAETLWTATGMTAGNEPKVHNMLGQLAFGRGDTDAAIREFTRATELAPQYADAYNNMAVVYLKERDATRAAELFRTAVAINPNLWEAQRSLAAIAFQKRQYRLAGQHIDAAIAVRRTDPDLYVIKGAIGLATADAAAAKAAFQKALELDPGNPKAKEGLSGIRTVTPDKPAASD